MKEIKFTRESKEFVYWEGELVECLMQVAPRISTSLLYMHFVLNNALFKKTPSHTQHTQPYQHIIIYQNIVLPLHLKL